MKRSVADAFGAAGTPAPAAPQVFAPTPNAMIDPKAYFMQWQQQAAAVAPSAAPATGAVVEKTEVHRSVEDASAVKCAGIVKEKGQNFTTVVAIEALHTMAMKSSYKLREELLRQPHVRKVCERIMKILQAPPASLSIELLVRAAWSLQRFPDEVRGDAKATFDPVARAFASSAHAEWSEDIASKLVWILAKADIISGYQPLISQIVAALVRDQCRRVPKLSHEGLANLLWALARGRRHMKKDFKEKGISTIRVEANDYELFAAASKRIIAEVETWDVRLLAEITHTHHEVGIKDEPLMKAMCPRIIGKQKELSTDAMSKVVKAYSRFMVPLREESQGFRTLAVVGTGDFIRPSDKPKKKKKTYDQPEALYPNTPLHASGL